MGRLFAVVLLIQISLPGFCCIANRVVRSTARTIGFASPSGELAFWNSPCCGNKCCIPDSRPDSDCCSHTEDCAYNASNTNPESSHSDSPKNSSSNPSNGPSGHKLCECLDSDPMIPPSSMSIDLDTDHYVLEILHVPLAVSSRQPISTARFHPPPLRRHLYLCVIRC